MGSSNGRFSLRALMIVVALCSIPVAVGTYVVRKRNAWIAEVERLKSVDVQTAKDIVRDVDELCARLGRAPKDKSELERLLGREMPYMHDNGHPTPIHYFRTSEMSFILQYEFWATDDWIYDSNSPSSGWVQHWY